MKTRLVIAIVIGLLASAPQAPTAQESTPVHEWSGAGNRDTESIERTTREWAVQWTATPDNPDVGGVLSVVVHDAESGDAVARMSTGRITEESSDASVVRAPAGRYYLSISGAAAKWRVWIDE